MADLVRTIRTENGAAQIDYTALANLPDLSQYATNTTVAKIESEMSTLENTAVKSIAGITPDSNGNVTITPDSIGAATSSHTHTPASIGAATSDHNHEITSLSGTLSVAKGGTGATTAAAARTNLGITPANIGAVTMQKQTITLSTSGWSSSAPYTQSVSVSGITATDTLVCDLSMADATTSTAEDLQEAWSYIGKIESGSGVITATCYTEKPGIALTVNVLVLK